MPCEDEIARPDRPSARSWSTSFALIFRTIPDCSFRRVPYTHGGRSVDRAAPTTPLVVPNDATATAATWHPNPRSADPSEANIHRAGLRYPGADLRRLDLVEERGLNRNVIAQLATCSFIQRQQNVVFQGFTGSGKSYLGCALAKQACQHRLRAHYIRMPDLEEAWALAKDKPQGQTKFLRKYSTFSLLVIDEWLLDHPDEGMRSMLLELLERRYDTGSTVFCTQYPKKDWHARLGGAVHADAIMDRIVHNTIWIDTGDRNMREHTALPQ
nr:ATP-binding protein [Brachybacterium muris]